MVQYCAVAGVYFFCENFVHMLYTVVYGFLFISAIVLFFKAVVQLFMGVGNGLIALSMCGAQVDATCVVVRCMGGSSNIFLCELHRSDEDFFLGCYQSLMMCCDSASFVTVYG